MDIDIVQLASEVFSRIARYLPHDKASGIFNEISEIFGSAQACIAEAQLKYASATKKIKHESQLRQSKEDLYKHKLEETKKALHAAKAENLRIIKERDKDIEEKAKALERQWRSLLVEAEKRLHEKKEVEFQKRFESQEVLWKAGTQQQVSELQQKLEEHYEEVIIKMKQDANHELAEMAELVYSMQKRVEDMEAEQRQYIRQQQLMEEECKRLREQSRMLELMADESLNRARKAEGEAATAMERLNVFDAQNHEREDHSWFQSNVLSTSTENQKPDIFSGFSSTPARNGSSFSNRLWQQQPSRIVGDLSSPVHMPQFHVSKNGLNSSSTNSNLMSQWLRNDPENVHQLKSLATNKIPTTSTHHPGLDELLDTIM